MSLGRALGACACACALLAVGPVPIGPDRAPAETSDSDARAVEIANRVLVALGGRERWEALPGLGWLFQSAVQDTLRPGRRHVWNKHTGWHRVEGTDRQGRRFVIISRLAGPEALAWVDGVAIVGDSLHSLARRARALWVNDSYWLLMPYKLRDPGVRLRYEGEAREGDILYDKLSLSFDNVGLTPGDRYWVYVNRANHRVERWDYVLQGRSPPPETWSWEGYEQRAGLWFATARRSGDRVIHTREVEALTEFAPATFRAP